MVLYVQVIADEFTGLLVLSARFHWLRQMVLCVEGCRRRVERPLLMFSAEFQAYAPNCCSASVFYPAGVRRYLCVTGRRRPIPMAFREIINVGGNCRRLNSLAGDSTRFRMS